MPNEITLEVSILNLHYEVKGFDAIRELKEWLDEHSSNGWASASLTPPPEPVAR